MLKRSKYSLLGLIFILIIGFVWVTYDQAYKLVHHPLHKRKVVTKTPQQLALQVREVEIKNPQGMRLFGYYGAAKNGAWIMLQHGYKANRSQLFEEAKILQDAGFGVLITSVRAHDQNDGEQITFGVQEMADLQAWYEFILVHKEASDKVGILGNSMGAAMAIEYAASNPNISAVVSVSGFSSLQDTINVSVEHFTGLPAFPFAPAIASWAEWILNMPIEQVDATKAAAKLCQTPILVMQGGADTVVSVASGEWIYKAACGAKEFWFEEHLGHAKFDRDRPQEFAQRISQFFGRYLL
ncbi:MAG: alpha/beta hydrolase [Gammaproteobacteria bacterium]|jgi:hypothetical protein|nr:alpha/beta hydrolase [Gammaproteobacteria bacterium]